MGERLLRRDSRARIERDGQELHPASRGGRVVTTLTKTLELKLVEPNAHKRRKLRETREAYQQALHDAFDAGCTTQTEANDVGGQLQAEWIRKECAQEVRPATHDDVQRRRTPRCPPRPFHERRAKSPVSHEICRVGRGGGRTFLQRGMDPGAPPERRQDQSRPPNNI